MSPEPLVSIAMPCHEAARTLPMALASLIAQTYEHWECLLVDDGSTDRPLDIVDRANDPRIRYVRLDRNRGRGVARQIALDRARGELLGMLDADDWFYPSKLADQIEFLRAEPSVALVSTGMAILDDGGSLVGVRCCGPRGGIPEVRGPFDRLAPPPVAHAPSLIRMQAARGVRYDATLNLSEDVDFLIRILLDRRYAILPAPAYAYSEHGSVTLAKIVGGLRSLHRVFAKHRGRFPIASRAHAARGVAKECVYRSAFALGQGRRLIERRSRPPEGAEVVEFDKALAAVVGLASRLAGPGMRNSDALQATCGDSSALPPSYSPDALRRGRPGGTKACEDLA